MQVGSNQTVWHKDRIVLGILLCLVIVGGIVAGGPKAYGLAFGPFEMPLDRLAQGKKPLSQMERYVRITPDQLVDSGLFEYESKQSYSWNTAKFYVARVGDRLLIARVSTDFEGNENELVGQLIDFPKEMRLNVFDPLAAKGPEVKAALLPFYIDCKDYVPTTLIGIAMWLGCVAAAIWCFKTSRHRVMVAPPYRVGP